MINPEGIEMASISLALTSVPSKPACS